MGYRGRSSYRGSARLEEFLLDFTIGLVNLRLAYLALSEGNLLLYDKCGQRIKELTRKYEIK